MVTHVAYSEERYRTAAECLAGICKRLDGGWWLSDLRGPSAGGYIVIFGVSYEGDGSVEPAR